MASPSARFVHLHTHTEYSLLDGMGRIKDVVAAAAADGQPALAITDHGTLAGAWKLAHACKAAGIKPVLGSELYLAIGSRFDPQTIQVPRDAADIDGGEEQAGTKRKANEHLTVLAATPTGWLNLVKINNKAQESFKGKPLADFDLIAEHGEGLIVLTGCLGGPVAGPLARGDEKLAESNLLRLMDAVGRDNVYIEIMDHGIDAERAVLKPLAALAEKHGLTLVATNDAHFVHGHDCQTHQVWLAAQSKATLDDPKRFKFNGTGYHLRTEQEMRALRPDSQRWQDACSATVAIADRVDDWVLPESKFRMPRFTVPDGFDGYEDYLHQLVRQGAVERYGSPLPAEVKTRLRHESDVINSLGFGVYFLILHEMIAWARSQNILVGPGRGSAAGSALAYCLRITDVEPLGADLLFERFLEPGRTDMPDIDVDFEQRRIPEIHAHLRELYGSDFVARLGTFAMARTKRAIKDAARVYGRNDLGIKLTGLVPVSQGKPAGLAELANPDFAAGEGFRALVEADDLAQTVLGHARTVENAVLGAGIHPCGVVVSGEPLTDLVPMRKDRAGANKDLPPEQQPWVTDWDGKDTEAFGLLKLDALFLRSLDVLAETSRIIDETTGEHVDFDTHIDAADLSDPKVAAAFALLREGRTSAIFQMESPGMRDLLVGSGPTSLEDLSAISALYRPGPLSAGMGDRYVERRNGREDVDYGIYTDDLVEQEWLASVLANTEAVLCYQEQMMQLGTVVAGFDAAGRAKLRRAIGKKKADLMAEVGTAFLDGAGKEFRGANGEIVSPVFSRRTAERLWEMFKGAASYAFNKSHSFAYGRVTFLTAYAKANWPAQTAAAVLACTDDDEKRRRVLLDLAADGIEVAPPDINDGRATTSVGTDGRLRLGMAEIKDVGKAADLLIAERDARGPFTSLLDLTTRMSGSACSVKVFEALIEAGALDSFGPRLGMMLAVRADRELAIDAEWGGLERSERQRNRLGVRVGEHPLTPHRDALRAWRSDDGEHFQSGEVLGRPAIGVTRLRRTDLGPRGKRVLVAGVLTRWEQATSNSGESARFDLEGSDGSWVEGIMWTRELNRLKRRGVPALGSVIAVDGYASRRTIQVRSTSDGSDIDARDGDADTAEHVSEVEVMRLRADAIEVIDLPEVKAVRLAESPVRISVAAAAERGRRVLAARKLSKRRRPKPSAPAARPSRAPSRAREAEADTGSEPQRAEATAPPAAAPNPDSPTVASDTDSQTRTVMVSLAGAFGPGSTVAASSRDGELSKTAVKAFESRCSRLRPATVKAKTGGGLVYRMTGPDGGELFVVSLPGKAAPRNWWRGAFEVLDSLPFGAAFLVDTIKVQVSEVALDWAALTSAPAASSNQPALPLLA